MPRFVDAPLYTYYGHYGQLELLAYHNLLP